MYIRQKLIVPRFILDQLDIFNRSLCDSLSLTLTASSPKTGCPENKRVILRQNDLKLSMHVNCHNAQCSAPKPSCLVQVHGQTSGSNLIKQLVRALTPSIAAGI